MFALLVACASAQLIIPTLDIGNGLQMPLAGIGTWLYNDTVAYESVKAGLDLGITHIDTAWDYQNAKGVGRALKESSRPRDSYFITTKIEGGLNYSRTIEEHMQNIAGLGVSYVDLLLTHFPDPMDDPSTGTKELRQEQWRALEFLQKSGLTRGIGTSHYCQSHMEDVLEIATIRPLINQVEYHVGMGTAGPLADDYKDWMLSQNITFQSFSPLCGPCCMGQPSTCTYDMELITGDMVTSIGKKYGKTGAQVALKWLVQQNIPVIPKSANPEHILQNMQLFDFKLSDEDMATLTNSPTPPVTGGGDGKTSGDCSFP